MRATKLFQELLGLKGLKVRSVEKTCDGLRLHCARTFERLTCPRCGKQARGRESERERSWRHMGGCMGVVILTAKIRRFRCRPCDAVVTEDVPWARHDSDFTFPFEDAVARLVQMTNRTAVAELTGLAWATVGNIAARVVAEKLDACRFARLRRIAVDEISFRKRHRYLTVVTDHDTRQVVWAGEGRSSDILKRFFEELDPAVRTQIRIVTMDMSAAFQKAVRESLPQAETVFDHFHVLQLANDALDEVRRDQARNAPTKEARHAVKDLRWALRYGIDTVRDEHLEQMKALRPNSGLGKAWLLKEHLSDILHQRLAQPIEALDDWILWAAESELAPFVKLSATVRKHRAGILAFMRERITNGLAEGMNNKIRLLSHRAFGFHSPGALVAQIMLCCAGIALPHLQLL